MNGGRATRQSGGSAAGYGILAAARHEHLFYLWVAPNRPKYCDRGGAAGHDGCGVAADGAEPPGSRCIVEMKTSTSRKDPEYLSTVGSVSGRQQAIA